MKHQEFRAELRAEPSRTFSGYASVFGVVDSFKDTIQQGAFARTLAARAGRIAMLWQHDQTQPIGVWDTLREDSRGLFVSGRLAETPEGERAYRLLKLGAFDGLSIGFVTKTYDITTDGVRTLTDLDLYEVSLVTFPANEDARITEVRRRVFTDPVEELLAVAERNVVWARDFDRRRRHDDAVALADRATRFLEAENRRQHEQLTALQRRVDRIAAQLGA